MLTLRRILDGIALVCGLWLVVSTIFLLPLDRGLAVGTLIVFGLLAMAFSIWAETEHSHAAPEVLTVILGALVFLSPWVLGITDVVAMTWNCMTVGGVLIGLKVVTLPYDNFMGPPPLRW